MNFIPFVRKEGVLIDDPRAMRSLFAEHFQYQFGQKRASRFKVDFGKLFEHKSYVDLPQVEIPFTLEEIKSAVFDLGHDKAPGPNGFPQFFVF